MLLWILVLFFVCWSPLETMLLFMEYTDKFPGWWSEIEWISYFMAYANTAVNPYIYAGMSENYKVGFKLLTRRFTKKSNSDHHSPKITYMQQPDSSLPKINFFPDE